MSSATEERRVRNFVCMKYVLLRHFNINLQFTSYFHPSPPARRSFSFYYIIESANGTHECKVKLMCSLSVHDVCACRWRVFCSLLETINQPHSRASVIPIKCFITRRLNRPTHLERLHIVSSSALSVRRADCPRARSGTMAACSEGYCQS